MIIVGTCGFPKSRTEVFGKLRAVEVQETFYKFADPATVKRWRREAPKEFVFAVKASQFITHDPSSPTYRRSGLGIGNSDAGRYGSFKPTTEVLAAWRRTEETCKFLDAKAVVFQTPASFKPTEENVENLHKFLGKAETKMIRVWEPRGEWPQEVIKDICERWGLVHCVDPFAGETTTLDVAYFRLLGKPPGTRNYYYAYSDADLTKLRAACQGFGEVYVFFNNIAMFADATRFRGLLDVQE